MRRKKRTIEVVWQQESGPDAKERLLAAYKMLLQDALDKPQQTAQQEFDKSL